MRELEERADVLFGTYNDGWFVMKAGGRMPDDIVTICRLMGLFKDED